MSTRSILFAAVVVGVVVLCTVAHAAEHPENWVNVLAGTASTDKLSTGNTLPIVARPWGFNHWAPVTRSTDSAWFFHPNDHEFHGIRCTHQPSPWIGDWGWFLFDAQVNGEATSYWQPKAAVLKPYLFSARFGPHGQTIDFTPTMHGAIARVRFPRMSGKNQHTRRVVIALKGGVQDGPNPRGESGLVVTSTNVQVGGQSAVANFRMFIRIKVDAEGAVVRREGSHSSTRLRRHRSGDAGMTNYVVDIPASSKTDTVIVRMATSFLSHDQAAENMRREVDSDADFDSIADESRREWRSMLGRVDVLESSAPSESKERDQLVTFYTSLYRALLFPRRLDETTSDDRVVHWSPYARESVIVPHPGPGVTDNGFWDTFRTVYPLLTIAYPDKLGEILQGWVNAFDEGGWLPKWASPGYRDSMVGTYCDVVLADAIVKGETEGFDVSKAWDAMRKDAEVEAPANRPGLGIGRKKLGDYKKTGWVPSNTGTESTSRTLDFAYADFAIANAAEKLGHATEARAFRDRAKRAYASMFNPTRRMMGPRTTRGFAAQDPTLWGGAFTEGAPWHHTFSVQYDVDGLADLYGGKGGLLSALQEMVETPSTFRPGTYGREIHEMTEFRQAGMGQYAANNQPMHSALYLFGAAGDPSRMQAWVRLAMDHAFGPDFYAGDEDNGEMGAWYVLSAIGIFPLAPGTSRWILGSPLFRRVRIAPPGRAPLVVVADSNTLDAILVDRVSLNGEARADVFLEHDDLKRGGSLEFVMRRPTPREEIDLKLPVRPMLSTLEADVGVAPASVIGQVAPAATSSFSSSSSSSSLTTTTDLQKRLASEKLRSTRLEAEIDRLRRESARVAAFERHPAVAPPSPMPLGRTDSDITPMSVAPMLGAMLGVLGLCTILLGVRKICGRTPRGKAWKGKRAVV